MPFKTLAIAAALLAGGAGSAESPAAAAPPLAVVELGLTSPLEDLLDLERFRRELAERLVWTVRGDDRASGAPDVVIRFTAVRLDRGRVTASYQSDGHAPPEGLSKIASSLGPKAFMAFPDVCFSPDDPPAAVRALSGRARFDPDGLEEAIANVARTRELSEAFGLGESLEIEWGRHVVLILAASADGAPVRVRPLILVLQRE